MRRECGIIKMGIIDRIKKHYVIKAYVKKLPRVLKKKYGKHKLYSEKQVKSAIRWSGLNESYIDYGLAMYILLVQILRN